MSHTSCRCSTPRRRHDSATFLPNQDVTFGLAAMFAGRSSQFFKQT
jgi:hypothetical protein